MKKLLYLVAALSVVGLWSCSSDDENQSIWEAYTEWRDTNDAWILTEAARVNNDGTLYYEKIVPEWNPGGYVLVHWFNDRSETAGNLQPMLTSTIKARYIGRLYNDEPFDSSFNLTDGAFTQQLSNVIEGWQIALLSMHVGDTCQIVVPYSQGYGAQQQGVIPPYSTLRFNMRLLDIPAYEIRP